MSPESTPDEAAQFLREFKAIVTTARGLDLVPRPENNATVLDLGLNEAAIRAVILGLSVADYCAGPKQDESRPGEVWFFGKEINGHEVYIKLKIATAGSVKIAKCISFHKADYALRYPLR